MKAALLRVFSNILKMIKIETSVKGIPEKLKRSQSLLAPFSRLKRKQKSAVKKEAIIKNTILFSEIKCLIFTRFAIKKKMIKTSIGQMSKYSLNMSMKCLWEKSV